MGDGSEGGGGDNGDGRGQDAAGRSGRTNTKRGPALADVPGVPRDVADRLRDQLSVTTVDELLDVAARFPDDVARLVGRSRGELEQVVAAAAAALPTDRRGEGPASADVDRSARRPFGTGHEPPPAGHDTFDD